MVKIDFNNKSKSPLKKSFLEKIAAETIRRAFPKRSFGPARSFALVIVSFASVSEKEIKELNKKYRKKNAPTDVLSFPEYESRGAINHALRLNDKIKRDRLSAGRDKSRPCKKAGKDSNMLFLGEVILCYNDIAKYCKKNKLVLKQELSKVVAHGVLHLLGFRHGKEMDKIQGSIISNPEFYLA